MEIILAIDKRGLIGRLRLVFAWYKRMVNEETGRLAYMYHPERDATAFDSPIRDIAAIWDIELLSNYLKNRDLQPFVQNSLRYYSEFIRYSNTYAFLDPQLLGESSDISHSAFMILALSSSEMSGKEEKVIRLADGILRQQRSDGSYKIYFGNESDDGLDLYPGEAMLALMEVYRFTLDRKYLKSVERGFYYYKSSYYEGGMVEPETLVYFANWQSQFSFLLFQHTETEDLRKAIREYLFKLHDKIIEEAFYKSIEHYPHRYYSVAVACALEGLNDAYSLAFLEKDRRIGDYHACICSGLTYLLKMQCIKDCAKKEKGSFGFSLMDRTQRVDVTGHAVNAIIKSLDNRVYRGSRGKT